MQTDEDAVLAECQGVRDDVLAHGQVHRTVGVDGLLEDGRIVRPSVAARSEAVCVHPRVCRWQGHEVGGDGRWKRFHRPSVEHGLRLARGPEVCEVQAVGESLHDVVARRCAKPASALAEEGEGSDVAARHVLHVDLGTRAFFEADDHRGPGDVLEAGVLHVEIVGLAFFDLDGRRYVTEVRPNERQARGSLTNGRLTLAFEAGVEQRVLPARRRCAGPNAVLAADEANILGDVASLVNACQTRADSKLHVGGEAVLRVLRSYTDGARIPGSDLEIDIAQCRVERSGIRIWAEASRPLVCGRRRRAGSVAQQGRHTPACGLPARTSGDGRHSR